LNLSQLEENPFQIRWPALQDLLQNIEVFRWVHSVDAEIKRPGGNAMLAIDLIEELGRYRVIKMAGPDENGIELIFVFDKKAQLGFDVGRNSRRQEGVQRPDRPGKGQQRDKNAGDVR
jgi:hypothetical protein